MDATLDERGPSGRAPQRRPMPGLVLVFTGQSPTVAALPLLKGELLLGRGEVCGVSLEDAAISRRHARVALREGEWIVQDQGSRNGTYVDGEAVVGELRCALPRVLRVGTSLFLLRRDVGPYRTRPVEVRGGLVVGPNLREALDQVERAARSGSSLHIAGESGAGKEIAARAFHAAGAHPEGPFVAVNCAAIPKELAERLLFGARRGAYSGADRDAEGYVQAADGGTLFLDEVAELDLSVQAKLLRVLEAREVAPLGAAHPQRVDVRVCSATLRSLRAEVAARRFREDLYFRLGRPEVALPPLRERLEEIPWHIQADLSAVGTLPPSASLVEACLARSWPGNVRELRSEVRAAAALAHSEGARAVGASHLKPQAGEILERTPEPFPESLEGSPGKERIVEVLRREGGNVSAAARVLGLHRTQLRRYLERHGLDPASFTPGGGESD